MDRVTLKHEPTDDDDGGVNNHRRDEDCDCDETLVVRTTTAAAATTTTTTPSSSSSVGGSAAHDRKRARTSDAASSSAAVTIPLAELTALQQQRADALQRLALAHQQAASVQQRLSERIDTLSQQLVERADRIATLSTERAELIRQRDDFSTQCDTLSTKLQQQREQLERERDTALAQREAAAREWDARLRATQQQVERRLSRFEALERAFDFEVLQRPQLERQNAHRPLLLAAVDIHSHNPHCFLSRLPRLGPLQLISRCVHAPRLHVIGGVKTDVKLNEALLSFAMGCAGSWSATPCEAATAYVAATRLNHCFHWCGGRASRASASAKAFALDERAHPFRFETLPSLSTVRWLHALHSYRDVLIAAGGFDGEDNGLSSVECLRSTDVAWAPFAAMPQARVAFASCVLGHSLHVAGGTSRSSPGEEHTRLDLSTGQWYSCASPPPAQAQLWSAAATLANCFVVTGGATDMQLLSLVSLYDPRSDHWQTRAPLTTARCHHTCCVLDHRLFVLGGFTSSDFCRTAQVDEYDFAADRWRTAPFTLPVPLSAFGAAIVE